MQKGLVGKNSLNEPLIVMGLGNPGQRYESTRHNAGYRVVDIMLQDRQTVFRRRGFSWVQRVEIPADGASRSLILIRWSGYMNESGGVVGYLKRRYSLALENLYIVLDNMDLPPGACRLKKSGGDAGHNGLKSLIRAFGDGTFNRMYIGIGRPKPGRSVVDHVLGKPDKSDGEAIENACVKASTAIWMLRNESFEKVAESINRRESC